MARKVFEDALGVNYLKVDELALVWCEYAEFELAHGKRYVVSWL